VNPSDQQSRGTLPIALFDYHLPEELIAQEPLPDRAASRLLVLGRESGEIQHARFDQIEQWLREGDVLVVNDTRVFPARLRAQRQTGGQVELLLVQELEPDRWLAMARPTRRLKTGESIQVVVQAGKLTPNFAEILAKRGDGMIEVHLPESHQVMNSAGEVPLPGYIHAELNDADRYQTVYARESGSVAAPTAGLHFTDQKLDTLKKMGIKVASVTLHVGPGTFQPVNVEDALDHRMHAERYSVQESTLQTLRDARADGRRVIAVGTTSCRTLESIADRLDDQGPLSGDTALYITPGFNFRLVDGLITNFHLPKSTLLLLVSALAGRESVLRAYDEAIEERYRFYSFGDAMLIL
jgi:S-adenosylmethionine:tRNA ribosyltransferase-isomerase